MRWRFRVGKAEPGVSPGLLALALTAEARAGREGQGLPYTPAPTSCQQQPGLPRRAPPILVLAEDGGA